MASRHRQSGRGGTPSGLPFSVTPRQADIVRERFRRAESSDPLEVLRSAKSILSKATLHLRNNARSQFARALTSRALAHYWNEIQRHDTMSFALTPGFERIPDVPIESVFATAAAAVGRAAAQIDTIGAGYFIGS